MAPGYAGQHFRSSPSVTAFVWFVTGAEAGTSDLEAQGCEDGPSSPKTSGSISEQPSARGVSFPLLVSALVRLSGVLSSAEHPPGKPGRHPRLFCHS